MPIGYYVIPSETVAVGTRTVTRPQYVDAIQCNWTGHPVSDLGVYICKVNTSNAKHTDLAGRTGVRQMPRAYTWDTVISTLPAAARNAISNWCSGKNIPYDDTETIGQFLMRVISSGLFSLGSAALNTQFQNLTQTQKDRITALCVKWSMTQPTLTETVRQITNRYGPVFWPGNTLTVDEF